MKPLLGLTLQSATRKIAKGACTCTEQTETILAVQLSLVVSTLFSVKGLANQ